jgi:hypothetical protein
MKIPQTTVNFIVSEVAKRKLAPGEFFTKVVSSEDAILVVEAFLEWANQNNKIEDGKLDVSSFMK